MADDAVGAFDAYAPRYNAERRKIVPSFDAFYGAAVEAISLDGNVPRRVLDLGAGTGLLSAWIAEAHPQARFVLQDASPAMLERASEMLGDRIEEVVVSDFADPLPAGPFDAVVSSLAIHHIADDAKRDLYARTLDVLAPGAWFVNAEHIAGATKLLDEQYHRWHETESRRLGLSSQEWEAALERFRHDVRTPVADQLAWLNEIGFSDVDCLWRDHSIAVMIGRKAR
jgi:tRNA (cmo5U34)-methyltransferase